MWVDWKKTGVKGWTNPDDGELRAGRQAPSKDSEAVQTELWYGAKPKSTVSTYLEPKGVKGAEGPRIETGGTLNSYAKMSLGKRPEEGEKVRTWKVNVEFQSTAFALGDGRYLYTVSWQDRAPRSEKEIRVRWPSESFVAQMIRHEYPEHPEKKDSEPSSHVLRLDRIPKGVYLVDGRLPVYETVIAIFVDREGREMGSTPVSIFRPK
jgi:hypothetical protein